MVHTDWSWSKHFGYLIPNPGYIYSSGIIEKIIINFDYKITLAWGVANSHWGVRFYRYSCCSWTFRRCLTLCVTVWDKLEFLVPIGRIEMIDHKTLSNKGIISFTEPLIPDKGRRLFKPDVAEEKLEIVQNALGAWLVIYIDWGDEILKQVQKRQPNVIVNLVLL